jgi:hypothetical protein
MNRIFSCIFLALYGFLYQQIMRSRKIYLCVCPLSFARPKERGRKEKGATSSAGGGCGVNSSIRLRRNRLKHPPRYVCPPSADVLRDKCYHIRLYRGAGRDFFETSCFTAPVRPPFRSFAAPVKRKKFSRVRASCAVNPPDVLRIVIV